jgi:hypothetical protein
MKLQGRKRVWKIVTQLFSPKLRQFFEYRVTRISNDILETYKEDGSVYYNCRLLVERIGISADAFWKWMSQKRFNGLCFKKVGKSWYVKNEDVDKFMVMAIAKGFARFWSKLERR